MLNPNFMLRGVLIELAREGIVEIAMRRQDGTIHRFLATLRATALECAKDNADLYYKSINSSRYKETKKRKAMREGVETWHEKVDKSINLLFVVDPESCTWRKVSVRRLVEVIPIEYVGA